MAQQIFSQWAPVAKAQNEQGQDVYLPFAGIHAQTRDGKDEIIVGAGNMVWTGSMWVPVSDQNRLPVEATLSGSSVPYTAPLYVNRPVRSQVQTLLNAVSVPAGGNTGWVNVSPDGARYIILLFNCDQPWRAWTNAPWAPVEYGFLYPRRDDADQNPSTLVNYPDRSVVVAPLLEGSVASMAEAFAAALPWSGLQVRISNRGAAMATITLRVLRLFV